MKPKHTGWYWFLPDENCDTPTGLINLLRPVVVLVGVGVPSGEEKKSELVVRFSNVTIPVKDMSGDWEAIVEPRRMTEEVSRRCREKGNG